MKTAIQHEKPAHGHKNERSLGTFVRRHNRLVVIVGALVVFLTFIIKEGMRESIKDEKDAIHDGLNMVTLRGAIETANEELRDSKILLVKTYNLAIAIQDKYPAFTTNPTTDGQIAQQLLKVKRQLVSQHLESMEALLKLLRKNANDAILEDFHARTVAADISARKLEQQMIIELGENFINGDISQKLSAQTNEKAEKFGKRLDELRENSDLLMKNFLKDAQQAEEKDEQSYIHYTWCSYGLYFVGWALTLIGRLYGVDGLSAEEG